MRGQIVVVDSRPVVDVIRLRGGLLCPRWSFLAALLLTFPGWVIYLIWSLSCSNATSIFVCKAHFWPFLPPVLWTILIMLLFLMVFFLIWVGVFIVGYTYIEAPMRPHSLLEQIFSWISDAEAVRWLLAFYGVIIVVGMIKHYLLDHKPILQNVPFALSIILILTILWTFLYPLLLKWDVIKPKELEPAANAIMSPRFLFKYLFAKGDWHALPRMMEGHY